MIETEEQRRWWFATHPQYSWSRRGIRKEGGVDPKEVDKYVDRALKYETGPVADLLRSVKRNFGTEAQLKEELAKLEEARKADIKGLEADPHTFLDIVPYRRFITTPISALKDLLRGTARSTILNAVKKGETGAEQAAVRTTISKTRYPEGARHIEDALATGRPSELTIERAGARSRGRQALRGYATESGKDLDEYPPKMFKEGGSGASVRPISPTDNRGMGASVGNRLRKFPDGTRIKIEVED
jgi:hypothetical protein